MSNWQIIVPEATRNMVLNPSAEIAGNFAALGIAAVTRQFSEGRYGFYAYEVECTADNDGIALTISALANSIHYVSMLVYVVEPIDFSRFIWDWSLDGDVTSNEPAFLLSITGQGSGEWMLYGFAFPAAQANGSTELRIRQKGDDAILFFIDGIQVEQKASYWTTFCDGDQDGCWWEGTEHGSTSRRSDFYRGGGRMRDLEDDYYFNIEAMNGVGAGPHDLSTDSFALLPGGQITGDKLSPRQFALIGTVYDDTGSEYHDKRANLLAILSSQSHPDDNAGPQATRLWYTGVDLTKYIDAYYRSGLELKLSARRDPCYFERNIPLRFLAPDPLWYELTSRAESLDSNDSLAVRYIAGKITSQLSSGFTTGVWDNLSVGATGGIVYAIAVGPDGSIYAGGDFATIDGVANTAYVAKYSLLAETWTPLSNGLDDVVYALAFGPDGTLYAGGDFLNGDGGAGDANADKLAQWNGSAWSAVGGAGTRNGAVRAIIFDADGNLIIGGDFTSWMGDGDADSVATWDGTTWGHLDDEQVDDDVYALALAPNGDIYIGGEFHNGGGVTLSHVCRWDGTDYLPLGTSSSQGVNADVYALAIDRSGQVIVGGAFTTARGDTVNRITMWNGTMFEALGNGLGGTVYALTFGPDDVLWVGGAFSSMTDLGWIDRLARWRDSSWAAVDINLPGAPTVYSIATGVVDPILNKNYDIFVGFTTTGTAYVAGDRRIVLTKVGTSRHYPKIVVERSGGTTARLLYIKLMCTGEELNCDYSLQDGERITIDLLPMKKRIVSSFYGEQPSLILPNSDLGSFSMPSRVYGSTTAILFVDVVGAPTITSWLEWRNTYESLDSE